MNSWRCQLAKIFTGIVASCHCSRFVLAYLHAAGWSSHSIRRSPQLRAYEFSGLRSSFSFQFQLGAYKFHKLGQSRGSPALEDARGRGRGGMVSRCHKTLAKCSSKRVKLQLRAGHLPQSITGPQHVDCLGAGKGWVEVAWRTPRTPCTLDWNYVFPTLHSDWA